MFELFTFGAAAQTACHNIQLEEEEAFPSPTDTSCASLPPPTSYPFPPQEGLGDIVNQFSQYTLQPKPCTPSFDLEQAFQTWHTSLVVDNEEMDQEMTTPGETITRVASAPQPQPTVIPTRESLACRRLQRQINAQMQINSTHIRDINSLVEDMISSSSQCTLRKRPSSNATAKDFTPSPTANQFRDPTIEPFPYEIRSITPDSTDEGFHEDLGLEEKNVSLRGASTPSRIRKEPLRYRASSECAMGGNRVVVRRLPRMRKRKAKAPASVAE